MAESGRKRLIGKVAIVTGSGRGIGRAEATLLAQQGARVVVNDIGKDPETGTPTAEKVADEIHAVGGEAVAATDSISTLQGAERIVEAAVKAFGRVDILVNNAGQRAPAAIEELTEEGWDRVLNSHLKGAFAMIKFTVPLMKGQRSGVIINTGSESGLGHPFNGAYAAAKEGLAGLTRTLARELGAFGIRCNMIRPRALTPGSLEFMQAYEKYEPWRQTMGRYWLGDRAHIRMGDATPERVANLVVWLCTDAAAEVNGRGFFVSADSVGLWSEPDLVHHLNRPGGWDLDALDAHGPENLIIDLQNNFRFKIPDKAS